MAATFTAELRTKAQQAKATKVAARRASSLRRDFEDKELWEDLARQRKLRLPPWGEACTMTTMRQWLHKAGWSQGQCEDWLGCPLRQFSIMNPSWPVRAFAGIILEVQKEDAINNTTEQREKK